MCGITGLFDSRNRNELRHHCFSMIRTLKHRGPDDLDVWSDNDSGIALGHSRLSIIDLSPTGHQPMVSSSGRWVIVYNGEVYNASEIRTELGFRNISFRGTSDTEVILEAVSAWGVHATTERLIGMFAMALWDRHKKTLYLVRDRLGIKPLYWGHFNGLFLFGSELKALRKHPGWKPEIDRNALTGLMRHNYIPAPLSIYKDVYKLLPGHILTLQQGREPRIDKYWDFHKIAVDGVQNPDDHNDISATEELDKLLRDAVKRRMVADVPLGALLSGGIDSSVVVALMQAQSTIPVKTFSIGFHEQGYNEAQHASEVARHLGTDHTELYVNPEHALEVLPNLCEWYDEPFADSSQIPTYLVSELTKQHVTVALSGDGGDELFGGYTRYFWANTLWKRFGAYPQSLKHLAATGIKQFSVETWDNIAGFMPQRFRPSHAGDKAHKLADILTLDEPDKMYRWLVSFWQKPGEIVLNGHEPYSAIWDTGLSNDLPNFTDRMQYIDALTYLPDDILTKVDRASMAVSLEARVPLLDHRVVEFAWRQRRDLKIRNGQGKWLLRQVLHRYVPREIIERPKMGFGVPIDKWLRGPLREWAEDLLDEDRLRADGYLNPGPVRKRWHEHLSGRENWQYQLWGVLMFQSWLDYWG